MVYTAVHVILITFSVGIFILTILKVDSHFKYLKSIYPEKFSAMENSFELYRKGFFNADRFLLVMPFFRRNKALELHERQKELARRVLYLIRLFWLTAVALITFIVVSILLNEL